MEVGRRPRFHPFGVEAEEAATSQERCKARIGELQKLRKEQQDRELKQLLGGSIKKSASSANAVKSAVFLNSLNVGADLLKTKVYTGLWQSDQFADVILELHGGEKLFAHHFILEVRCPYLSTLVMETKGKKKASKRQIITLNFANLEYLTVDIMARILRYIYGEQYDISGLPMQTRCCMYLAALHFELDEVSIKCGIHILKHLSTQNIYEVLKLAYSSKNEKLKELCMDFIHKNVREVLQHKKELSALGFDILQDVVSLSLNEYTPLPFPSLEKIQPYQVLRDYHELYERSRPGRNLEWTCDCIIVSPDSCWKAGSHKALLAAVYPGWAEGWNNTSRLDDITADILSGGRKAKSKSGRQQVAPSPREPDLSSKSSKKDSKTGKRQVKRTVSARFKERSSHLSRGSRIDSVGDSGDDLLKSAGSNINRRLSVVDPGEDDEISFGGVDDFSVEALSEDSFNAFLRFVYYGSVDIPGRTAFQLLPFSKKLQLYDLASACEKAIVDNLSAATIVDTFEVAYNPSTFQRRDMMQLREICKHFLLEHLTGVNLEQLYAIDPRIAIDVLKLMQDTETNKKQKELTEILAANNLAIVRAICELSCDKTVGGAICELFLQYHMIDSLLQMLFDYQVDTNDDVTTFFRRSTNMDTMSRHILSTYFLLSGSKYLVSTLRPVISAVCYGPDAWEIDQNRLKDGQTIKENMQNITAVSDIFVAQLTAGQHRAVPESLRRVCYLLGKAMERKFEDHEKIIEAVGGFFFFNFFCPAMLSPCDFGVWTTSVPQHALRGLILLSKILNALCSGVKFGPKEQYMAPLNSFIDQHSPVTKAFYRQMVSSKVGADKSAHEAKLHPSRFDDLLHALGYSYQQLSENVLSRKPQTKDSLTQLETFLRANNCIKEVSEELEEEAIPPTPRLDRSGSGLSSSSSKTERSKIVSCPPGSMGDLSSSSG